MMISRTKNQAMKTFRIKWKKVQYSACLAITGGIKGTSRELYYNELGLYSLVKRRWHNKLVFFL